jgi:hypothetical protein
MQLIHDDEMHCPINVSAKDCEVACQGREAPDSERAGAVTCQPSTLTDQAPGAICQPAAQGEPWTPEEMTVLDNMIEVEYSALTRLNMSDDERPHVEKSRAKVRARIEVLKKALATPAPTAGEGDAK